MHLGHDGVKLHIPLADIAAILDGFDAFSYIVRLDGSGIDGDLRDEDYGGAWEEGLLFC